MCLCSGLLGCALPALDERPESFALDSDLARDTHLGRVVSPLVDAHPNTSGIHPLQRPIDAFAARGLLAHLAERTLDVQYYHWNNDLTGTLLLEALHAAAERGVRVRLLLDDVGTRGLEAELAALNAHPNLEVRLFNPFPMRRAKWFGLLTDFPRLNRRMHNKSFTADNQVAIVGGRNVGDAYFGAAGVLYSDLDVLTIGPIVEEISRDFDRYWSSESAHVAEQVLRPIPPDRENRFASGSFLIEQEAGAAKYMSKVGQSALIGDLLYGQLPFEWAKTRILSDDPAKALGLADKEALLIHQLEDIKGEPQGSVTLVSPYFVPTAASAKVFSDMARRGVDVRILTNSSDATPVPPVHAGYARRRRQLLEAGVKLYELRSLIPAVTPDDDYVPFAAPSSALHAKVFSVDDKRVYIGSFNFDPRSENLNTEVGLVIESPTLARQISTAFDTSVRANAHEVRLKKDGRMYWVKFVDDEAHHSYTEPYAGFWRRRGIFLMGILPIEWLL
ncbi:phospholipase D family protein [Marinimicrobium sp. ABcell2]|uniref:phospholipase D family protein n=1 Tax=Marinimicrobium sp. ABcell2 TaxID=3069751 RepID=UPI0027B2FAD8|nr:phospholipase D family protein [Marinimicrobium sp. ABcell2]MDQ2077206.1 phospholipase D family protein [Marinimicrobium sp. ABcell2]